MTKLSERVRPDVEAAPWVIHQIKELEDRISRMTTASQKLIADMRLRARIRGDVDPDGTVVLDCGAGVLYAIDKALAECGAPPTTADASATARGHVENDNPTEACNLLERFVGHMGPTCRLDHHGYCQEHALEPAGECMVHMAQVFLAKVGA